MVDFKIGYGEFINNDHNHTADQISGLAAVGDYAYEGEISGLLNHSQYAYESELSGLMGNPSGFAYEGEISGLLNTPPGSAAWGGITGTLSNQTDLDSELSGKASLIHNHDSIYSFKGEISGILNTPYSYKGEISGILNTPYAYNGEVSGVNNGYLAHKANNGTDHSYINQSVKGTDGPTFNHLHITNDVAATSFTIGANTLATGEFAALDGINAAWTPWVPTVVWGTATPASLTTSYKYKVVGKTTYFMIAISSTDGNAASSLTITTPNTPAQQTNTICYTGVEVVDGVYSDPIPYFDATNATPSSRAKFYFGKFLTWTDTKTCGIYVNGFYET